MKTRVQTFASFFVVMLFIILAVASNEKEEDKNNKNSTGNETTTSTKSQEKNSEESNTKEVKEKQNWQYSEEKDKMSGKTNYFAFSTSTNKLEFEFPYQGGSTFTLVIRNMGQGNNVMLGVSKGQFMGSIMGSQYLRVKFDDEQPVNYPYNSPQDASSTSIFLTNEATFISKLKKAKKLMIEAPFFNAGRQIIYFNVDGFKWSK